MSQSDAPLIAALQSTPESQRVDINGVLIQSMGSPLVAATSEGTENFDSIGTAQAHSKARPKLDNLLDPELLNAAFNPTNTQQDLEKINSKLKTTIIINRNLPQE
jgi:hypothetical protein